MVQGVTEFLPVSSSGHLVLIPWFLGWHDPGLAFNVFLHLGTLIAVVVYFVRDWMALLRAGTKSIMERRIGFERDRRLFWFLALATIPAALAGFLLHDYAESVFRSPLLVAVALAVLGFLLYWVDGVSPTLKGIREMKGTDAFLIGVAQAFAIVPGVSRSGATMTMGRWLGLRRDEAARFSFLLSLPIILGASVFEWRAITHTALHEISIGYLVTGLTASVVTGFLSIHFLLLFLRKADFRIFAWYRMGLAALILLWSLFLDG